MELLDYLEHSNFNLRTHEDMMNKYFSQPSETDLSYITNDSDYEYVKSMSQQQPPPQQSLQQSYQYSQPTDGYSDENLGNAAGIAGSGAEISIPAYHQPPQQHMDYCPKVHHLQQQPPQSQLVLASYSLPHHGSGEAAASRYPDVFDSGANLMYTTTTQQQPIQHTPIQQSMQQPHSHSLNNTPLLDNNSMHPYSNQSTPLQDSLHTPQGQIPNSPLVNLQEYPDVTTMINSNSAMVLPMVDAAFVDHKICTVCSKRITRDMSRHMRTHEIIPRFQCTFPKLQCNHKSGRFNRPYDFKKHLLNRHFKFDDPEIKKIHNLSDKLLHWGSCSCGLRFLSKDWLDSHILTLDKEKRCVRVNQN